MLSQIINRLKNLTSSEPTVQITKKEYQKLLIIHATTDVLTCVKNLKNRSFCFENLEETGEYKKAIQRLENVSSRAKDAGIEIPMFSKQTEKQFLDNMLRHYDILPKTQAA